MSAYQVRWTGIGLRPEEQLRSQRDVTREEECDYLNPPDHARVVHQLRRCGKVRLLRQARTIGADGRHAHIEFFGNLVASHLLKWVDQKQEAKGRDLELQGFRDACPSRS